MEESNPALNQALEDRRNVENAFDAEVARVGLKASRYFVDRIAQADREDTSPEDREGAAKLTHAKGHVELSDAGVASAEGDANLAAKCERRASRMFELRDSIRGES